MSPLWMSVQPSSEEVRLMLTEPGKGPVLKARLPSPPQDVRAMGQLLEVIVAWYGTPLRAVLDADALDVRAHPERWFELFADLRSLLVSVEWVAHPGPSTKRDRFLGPMGDFDSARRLLAFAATGSR
jgi:hypothetical protein